MAHTLEASHVVPVIVFVGARREFRAYRVFYYSSAEEIPEGFAHWGTEDIAERMAHYRATKVQMLEMMNR